MSLPTSQNANEALADKLVLSIQDAAKLSGFSRQTVTRLFEHAKGVYVLDRPETMHKRKHRTITIPRAVFDREMAKVTN